MITDIDHMELAQSMVTRAKSQGAILQGPTETSYGFGWIPTASIWQGDRRIHFYFSFAGIDKDDLRTEVYTAEIAFADFSIRPARTPISSLEDAWDVVDKFLIKKLPLTDIDGHEWMCDNADSNKHIPHPPNAANPVSISWLLSQGKWEPWKPQA